MQDPSPTRPTKNPLQRTAGPYNGSQAVIKQSDRDHALMLGGAGLGHPLSSASSVSSVRPARQNRPFDFGGPTPRHRPGADPRFGRSWFEIPQRSSLTPLLRYAILSVSTGEQALPRPTRWSNEASRVRHFDWWREPAADGPSAGPKPLRPKFNGW